MYASVVPEMNAISIPYLFKDTKEEAAFLDGKPGQALKDKLAAKDTVALSFLTRTGREITNSVRPIEKPADLKGLKIRVPGNTLWTDFFGKLGASPTTMAFSEVFTGLQTGTIDGQENPIEVPWTNKFSEVQKYVSMTNHINDAWVLALSSKKWETLSADQKKALTDASVETSTFKTGYDAEQSKKQLDDLAAKGMKANEVSAAGLEEFRPPQRACTRSSPSSLARNSSTRRSHSPPLASPAGAGAPTAPRPLPSTSRSQCRQSGPSWNTPLPHRDPRRSSRPMPKRSCTRVTSLRAGVGDSGSTGRSSGSWARRFWQSSL
ncbi:2,3-diketo-L-gulonate-binding periplasmic protein YiaO [Arthrobacter sp. Hiyo6]|nr:2,3-diketo-L-gulonate-binding periplasmic protein YiaO [Arthrobacter sp. Hiyo6]